MPLELDDIERIRRAAEATSEPRRAERNLTRMLESAREKGLSLKGLRKAAGLAADSQFLANYAVTHPDELVQAFDELRVPVNADYVEKKASALFPQETDMQFDEAVRLLRLLKKRCMLSITLRYLNGVTDTHESMEELSRLADSISGIALERCMSYSLRRHGEPPGGACLALIGLGKLGGEELNYSSDIDIVAVYADLPPDMEDGAQTSGVTGPTGMTSGRVSVAEFYSKTVEAFSKMLSSKTEDGVAFRVDLRLRPQGQKGDIALPLEAYRAYFESWARTWERMVYIRTRHVAGDRALGETFMREAEAFVWRSPLDYAEIEDIRAMKKRIDSTYTKNDIKRGYGGIREAEFFVQAFQLLYGAEQTTLRTHRLFNAIQTLRWMRLIPEEELAVLWDNYLYLRRLEHFLQMRDDIQTHTLPSSDEEMEALGRKMGFTGAGEFLPDLRLRRMQIKNMYTSLLGTSEDANAEALSLLEGDLGDAELRGYLAFRRVRDADEGLHRVKRMRQQLGLARSRKERTLIRKVMPGLLEAALHSSSPDRALAGLDALFASYGLKEAHLEAFSDGAELPKGLIRMFALSTYLSRTFMSSHTYLDLFIEERAIRKTLMRMESELDRFTKDSLSGGLALYRRYEEFRLGLFFLLGVISTEDLMRYLSNIAEASVRRAVDEEYGKGGSGLAVIALGKLGGREMTFGSDLDIIFLSGPGGGADAASRVLKSLTEYTEWGAPYSVDVRLRPDGSKGELVKDLDGYRNYYLKNARPWELQALLKARPVAGDAELGRAFMQTAREAVMARGPETDPSEIRDMRARILRELSKESEGLDIKLGPGGTEEIEFFVQGLQLGNAANNPEVLVQRTSAAIRRLWRKGVISDDARKVLMDAYKYYRKLETLMRLNEEHVVRKDGEFIRIAAAFMGHSSAGELDARVSELRAGVIKAVGI